MFKNVLKGLPTVVGSVAGLLAVFVPQAQDFLAQQPEFVGAFVALISAVANMTPRPGK